MKQIHIFACVAVMGLTSLAFAQRPEGTSGELPLLITGTAVSIGGVGNPTGADRVEIRVTGTSSAAARERLHACVAALWNETEQGGASLDDIAEVYGAAHHAMAQGRAAINAMYALGGASSLYTSSPLERAHRDMHAMAAHVIARHDACRAGAPATRDDGSP